MSLLGLLFVVSRAFSGDYVCAVTDFAGTSQLALVDSDAALKPPHHAELFVRGAAKYHVTVSTRFGYQLLAYVVELKAKTNLVILSVAVDLQTWDDTKAGDPARHNPLKVRAESEAADMALSCMRKDEYKRLHPQYDAR